MYIVTDNNTNHVLHVHPALLPENPADYLTGPQVYSAFDDNTMTLLYSELEQLPTHFKVNEKGLVVEKNTRDRVQEKSLPSQALFPDILTDMASTSDSSSTTENLQLHINWLLEHNLLEEREQRQQLLYRLNSATEKEIALHYSPGEEIKIMKDYLQWQTEGKPDNDSRETAFNEMNEVISGVTASYSPLRQQLMHLI